MRAGKVRQKNQAGEKTLVTRASRGENATDSHYKHYKMVSGLIRCEMASLQQ